LAKDIERKTSKARTKLYAQKFITFLDWQGDNKGLIDLFSDEVGEEDEED
jgi:hypothetical protein